MQNRRVTPAVEQEQGLLAALQALFDGAQQGRCEHPFIGTRQRFRQEAHVNHTHTRHRAMAYAAGHRQADITPFLHALPAFQ
jgi:hypothetical protein